MNVQRIKADIDAVCKMLHGETEEQSYCVDVAAYHAQQAIEKEIKYFLHNVYNVDDSTRSFRTHNITFLLERLKENDSNFIEKYQDLDEMSAIISEWEAHSRYEDGLCSTKQEVEKALGISKKLYKEILDIENKLRADNDEDVPLRPA